MRSIAIETSGRIGSVALAAGATVLAERTFPHGLAHAAKITQQLDAMCRQRGWSPPQVEAVMVSQGPGSFTGLRVGITLAKTFAYATGAKIVAVPSGEVLVRNAPPDARHVLIVLDAKRGQIYGARFERAGEAWAVRDEAKLTTLAESLSASPRPIHLIGEGLDHHRDAIPADPQIIETPRDLWRARAAALVEAAQAYFDADAFADPFQLEPIYIRRPEAEEKWAQEA